MTIDINKKAFDSCKLIIEEKTNEMVKRLYFCEHGFVEISDSPKSFEIKSYEFGYTKKIDLEQVNSLF